MQRLEDTSTTSQVIGTIFAYSICSSTLLIIRSPDMWQTKKVDLSRLFLHFFFILLRVMQGRTSASTCMKYCTSYLDMCSQKRQLRLSVTTRRWSAEWRRWSWIWRSRNECWWRYGASKSYTLANMNECSVWVSVFEVRPRDPIDTITAPLSATGIT